MCRAGSISKYFSRKKIRYLTSQKTVMYTVSDLAVTILKVRCYLMLKPHMGSNKPGLSARRPVFMSRVKPKVDVVAVV